MNDAQMEALGDALSVLDSVTWIVEARGDEEFLLSLLAQIKHGLDMLVPGE